jgi:Ca-activated chloride channel family protein
VNVEINDQVARTHVDQEFVNETDRRIEAVYIFPAPPKAVVTRMTMMVDGKPYEAELLSKEEARRLYERVVRTKRDPALLEYWNHNTFRLRMFPFPPHGKRQMQVDYQEMLRMDANTCRYVYPLRIERLTRKPIREVTITVRIKSRYPIKNVYSPTHDVSVRRPDDHTASVSFEANDVKPNTDFVLYYSVSPDDIGMTLLTHRERGDKRGYFMLLAAPKVEWEGKRMPKDVVFVLDRTGSMAGGKLTQAKEALRYCIANLEPEDRFTVIAFNESPDVLWDEPLPATEINRRAADKFFAELKPRGGTDINEALLKALSMLENRERIRFLIFLTDGLPTVGETNVQRILENVRKTNEARCHIFAFGVGYDVNAHFLDKLSDENDGASEYVRPNESVEQHITALFDKISQPVLTDVEIDFGEVRVSELYPKPPLPAIFRGSQLILVGTYRDAGEAEVRLSGKVGEHTRTFTIKSSFPEVNRENDFLPRLWAARKIGYLLDEVRLHRNKELIDEIVRLSKEFGILTEFTAFLIREPMLSPALARARTLRELNRAVEEAEGRWAVNQSINARKLQSARQVGGMVSKLSAKPAGQPGGRYGAAFGGTTVSGFYDKEGKLQSASQIQQVGRRTFYQVKDAWVDASYDPNQKYRVWRIRQYSDAVFQLVRARPELAKYLSLGDEVTIVLGDNVIQVGNKGKERLSDDELRKLTLDTGL